MRKFVSMAAVALMCAACNLFVVEERPYGSAWWVKNATARPLEITPPPYGSAAGVLTLAPGESAKLYSRSEYLDVPYFGMVMILWRGRAEEEVAFEVRSAEGEVLKRWTYDDGEGYGYNQSVGFFNEGSWTESSDQEKKRKKLCEWTFEITESDIAPQVEP